jgi:ligand-binding sensor domain-containing protein
VIPYSSFILIIKTSFIRFSRHKLCIVIAIMALFLIHNAESPAQRSSFREYNVIDGLPQSQILYIYPDSRGYLWIGTRNGLSRFDGVEFVNYFRTDGLPDNLITSVFEDRGKILWAISNRGLSRYNGNRFEYFPPPDGLAEGSFAYPTSVDTLNNIYLLANLREKNIQKIMLFRNGTYEEYSRNFPPLDTLKIQNFFLDNSTGSMLILDKHMTIWIWKNNVLKSMSGRKFTYMYQEHNNLMARSNDSLFIYSAGKFEFYHFIPGKEGYSIDPFQSSSGREVELFHGKQGIVINLPFTFSSFTIDNEKTLWFTTEGNMYHYLSPAFRTFDNEDIGGPNFWALAEDRNGHFFFGSLYNTLFEFDGKEFHERKEFRSLFKREIAFFKGSRRMSNGDVWFSTNSGVLIWDGCSFSVIKELPEDTQICYIYEDPDNKEVMLGTEKGLFIIRNNNLELINDFTDNGLGVIEGITKDKSGTYWLSGHNGIVRFDGKNAARAYGKMLPQEFTYTIISDTAGGLWVTSETGLYYRGKSSDTFLPGLPESVNSPANSIILMDNRHILTGRVKDICIIDLKKFYNKEKDYFRMYDKSDGFIGGDCLDNGIIRDRSGKFWILTSDNCVVLDPSQLRKNDFPPKVNITGIYYQTDSLTWNPVNETNFFYGLPDIIRLHSFQNKIKIAFNGISTTNPEKVKLQYRLEGYADKWSEASGKRFVIYEKLPPGHYRFYLRAFNADGVESVSPLEVGITMVPAFWQRTVSRIIIYLLAVLLAVSLSLYLIRRRTSRKEAETRMKNELTQLQMSSVLRQFDPHFTFNVISAIGSLIMKGEKENAYDYITILGGLLRTVLGEGSVIIKPLSDELDFVRRYCELQKLRFLDRISFSLTIDKNVDLQRTIPKMTIQLFVENAIKHGFENRYEGGRVEVDIKKADHSIIIMIADNGIGRAAASRQITEGTGNGLKMITGLFDVMNSYNKSKSTIEITDLQENNYPAGTSVVIEIPDDFRFEFGNSVRRE